MKKFNKKNLLAIVSRNSLDERLCNVIVDKHYVLATNKKAMCFIRTSHIFPQKIVESLNNRVITFTPDNYKILIKYLDHEEFGEVSLERDFLKDKRDSITTFKVSISDLDTSGNLNLTPSIMYKEYVEIHGNTDRKYAFPSEINFDANLLMKIQKSLGFNSISISSYYKKGNLFVYLISHPNFKIKDRVSICLGSES